MWSALRERFQQSNGPRIFQLHRELINLRQEHNSVSGYFTKLKSVWEELNSFKPHCNCGRCTCGGVKDLSTYHHNEYVMTFLMGSSDSFAHIRTQVLLIDPMPPINKVFAHVSQEENHQTLGSQGTFPLYSTNALAMVAKRDLRFKPANQQKSKEICMRYALPYLHGIAIGMERIPTF